MSFTLADFQAAANAKYGGLTIDDAPGGPLTIRNAMAISDDAQRAAVKAAITNVENVQGDEGTADLDQLPELQAALVGLLAALADRPADLQAYLAGQPLTVVVAIKDAWEESSSPKATS